MDAQRQALAVASPDWSRDPRWEKVPRWGLPEWFCWGATVAACPRTPSWPLPRAGFVSSPCRSGPRIRSIGTAAEVGAREGASGRGVRNNSGRWSWTALPANPAHQLHCPTLREGRGSCRLKRKRGRNSQLP
jgi:hypothetical protein